MRKIVIAAIITGTLLFLWSLSADAAQVGDYWKVERGESLSLISKKCFGTIDKWTYIRDLNNLENPHLIHVGQMLRIVDLPKEMKKDIAFETAWEYMTKYFKSRRGQKYPDTMTRADAYKHIHALLMFAEDTPTYQAKQQFDRTLTLLEWVDMLDIADAIKKRVDNHWHILAMAALGAQESGFRNVPGSHGELGPYQIKPSTAIWLLSDDVPIQNESEASTVLDMPFNNTWMAYKILQECGLTEDTNSLVPALEKYNAGSEKRKYARQIRNRFDKLLKSYNAKVTEALK